MPLERLHQAGGFTCTLADLQRPGAVTGFALPRLRKLRTPDFGLVVFTR